MGIENTLRIMKTENITLNNHFDKKIDRLKRNCFIAVGIVLALYVGLAIYWA